MVNRRNGSGRPEVEVEEMQHLEAEDACNTVAVPVAMDDVAPTEGNDWNGNCSRRVHAAVTQPTICVTKHYSQQGLVSSCCTQLSCQLLTQHTRN